MNTFITPTWVTTDVAVNWKNSIKLVGRFDRSWDSQWENKPQGAQIGFTVQARLPPRQIVSEGQALVQQAIINQTVPISLNHQYQKTNSTILESLHIHLYPDRQRLLPP